MDAEGRSIKTGRNLLDTISGVLVYALELELIEENPVHSVRAVIARKARSKRGRAEASDPEELVRRARKRCKHHRQPGVGGVCRECLLAEIEQAIAEEHPELERGEVLELVQEWLRLEDDHKH